MNWLELTNLLSRPIAFHRIFATIGGGTCCGVFLSQAFYWTPRTKDAEGWFYKSQAQWEEETALTRYEQETVRKRLKERGLIEEKKEGVPCRLFYRINKEKILDAIAQLLNKKAETLADSQFEENQQTSSVESNGLAEVEVTDKTIGKQQAYLYTKTTPEITHIEGACEKKFGFEIGGSPKSLVESSRLRLVTKEAQIIAIDRSSDLSLTPTEIYRPTKEDEAFHFGRRYIQKKGTYASRSSDPWMMGVNPNPIFVQWRYNTQLNDQKNQKEASRTFTPSIANARSEINDNYVRAAALWEEFCLEMHQRVEVFNSRVQAGISINEEEHQAIAKIAPYAGIEVVTPLVLAQRQPKNNLPVAPAPAVQMQTSLPPGADNVQAYKEYKSQDQLPSEEDRLANYKRLGEMAQKFKSMSKSKIADFPTTSIAKHRAWLKSGEPALMSEAIAWAKSHAMDLDIEYSENGEIIDFEELNF